MSLRFHVANFENHLLEGKYYKLPKKNQEFEWRLKTREVNKYFNDYKKNYNDLFKNLLRNSNMLKLLILSLIQLKMLNLVKIVK